MSSRAAAALLAVLLCGNWVAASAQQRDFQVDDLLRLESLGQELGGGGPYAVSRDGTRLAVTRVRARLAGPVGTWPFVGNQARADVWVSLNLASGLTNITQGERDGSGWFAPLWSPSGKRLAMLSTRGGRLRIWTWDAHTHALEPVSDSAPSFEDERIPFRWLDDGRLLFVTASSVSAKRWTTSLEQWMTDLTVKAWSHRAAGENSANVLDAGPGIVRPAEPDRMLLAAVNGQPQTLKQAALVDGFANTFWELSPDGAFVAFAAGREFKPQARPAFRRERFWQLGLVTVAGRDVVLRGSIPEHIIKESMAWSLSGRELAVLGYPAGESEQLALYVVRVERTSATVRKIATLPPGDTRGKVRWTRSGQCLVQQTSVTIESGQRLTVRSHWWLVQERGARVTELTGPNGELPRELFPVDGSRSLIGWAADRLWRYDERAKALRALDVPGLKVTQIVWPTRRQLLDREQRLTHSSSDEVLVTALRDGKDAPFIVNLRSGASTAIQVPETAARLEEYSPESRSVLAHQNDEAGFVLSRINVATGANQLLIDANRFLKSIRAGQFSRIEYTSLGGQPLTAWLLLPPDYRPGTRVPLLTLVYAGTVEGPEPDALHRINSDNFLNMQLAAAQGYGVLFPSMPLGPEGSADEPLGRLPDGVLPAVDKVIERGIADPARLMLIGHSFGGYSTYGLITQTDRFAAAVALSGPSDLTSSYGEFNATFRYTSAADEDTFNQALLEGGQERMGNPPWRDEERYVRNSPLFGAAKVHTPLIIIHGDLDFVPIQQGEAFYRALAREDRRVRFVRYWGEYHTIESAANIRDMWSRLTAWFADSHR